ncbi:MAG: lipoprotein-releasing ABC transporter permease subunit [Alphaproteobacteria bacterium]
MIFSKFERLLACRYLRSKRKEGFISVITSFAFTGIALGVATLIIVMSVMNGFRHELLSRILGLSGHIGISAIAGKPFNNYKEAGFEISKIDDVKNVAPIIEAQLLATNSVASQGVMLRGIEAKDLMFKDSMKESLKNFDTDTFNGDVVLIGDRLAQKMGLLDGDNITLLSPKGKITAFGTVPRVKQYKVLTTFNVGMYEYDANFIFMPLKTAQTFLGFKNGVTNIDITLGNEKNIEAVKGAIYNSIDKNAYVYDYRQTNSAFFNAIAVERNVMFLILTLIIIVAAFNIITGLIMLVKDKGRDIAVLRTMGATKAMIMRIFFLDGAFIGFVGTFLGWLLGLSFCKNIDAIKQFLESISGQELFSAEIYFLSKLPAKVDNIEVLYIVGISLLLSFVATIFPAYRASKFEPVEALRYE